MKVKTHQSHHKCHQVMRVLRVLRFLRVLTLFYMGFWHNTTIWGGAKSARRERMASEVNWGHYRGYQSRQTLFLTSLPVYRAFEQSPMLYSFAIRCCWSHLLTPWKIISFLVCENSIFPNFWAIWTICTSNQSWENSKFKFDMKKYNLLWKIRHRSDFLIFCIGKAADMPTLTTSCG